MTAAMLDAVDPDAEPDFDIDALRGGSNGCTHRTGCWRVRWWSQRIPRRGA